MQTSSTGAETIDTNNGKLSFNKQGNSLELIDDVKRMNIGNMPNTLNPSIKISKPGINVNEATDDQLIFNSDQNVFKIVNIIETTLSPPASWASGQVISHVRPHGLSGSSPAFLGYVTNPVLVGGSYYVPGLTLMPSVIHLLNSYEVTFDSVSWVDDNNLHIDLIHFNSAGTAASGFNTLVWAYKVYILQETAA